MEIEELKKIAKEMGYNLIPIKKYERFIPCLCGCNRRELRYCSYGTNLNIKYKCNKCGKEAIGKDKAEAKRNWNNMINKLLENEDK